MKDAMNVLFFLVPLALLLAAAGVTAFWWAVRDGQFEDTETPSIRILLDDQAEKKKHPEVKDDTGH